MDPRLVIVLLIFSGILLMAVALARDTRHCQERQIEYRYLPRDFNQIHDNPIPVSQIFSKMFELPSPWISGINTYDRKQQDKINKYFLSQM